MPRGPEHYLACFRVGFGCRLDWLQLSCPHSPGPAMLYNLMGGEQAVELSSGWGLGSFAVPPHEPCALRLLG